MAPRFAYLSLFEILPHKFFPRIPQISADFWEPRISANEREFHGRVSVSLALRKTAKSKEVKGSLNRKGAEEKGGEENETQKERLQ
ncbi:hypothetical protein [Candidatus Spyradosoma sp. SGI.093]|uniref:hypothetical protein n=1 Tax=Candidatus Spyradosoma sp. SGI.093 TaxID=3420583 RepID=UPI003D050186